MEDDVVFQQMEKNPMMVKKNQNPSYVFSINIDEPHPFLGLEWWKFTTMDKCHEF